MSRLTIPTSLALTLFVSGWAAPAGPSFEITHAEAAPGTTNGKSAFAELFDSKTTLSGAGKEFSVAVNDTPTASFTTASAPAETTNDILIQSGDAPAPAAEIPSDEILAAPERVRLPPRRAIAREVVCETLADAAVSNNLPTPFFIRLIWRESGFNQNAVSPVGAQGVAQFMPATAAEHRLSDPFDPLQALHASARFLRGLVKQFGNVGLAAAAYNAGPRRVSEWLASKKGKLPQETRDYVQNITGKAPEHWRTAMAAAPIKIPAAAPCQREAGLLAANGPAKIPLPPVIHTASAAKPSIAAKSANKTAKTDSTAAAGKVSGKPLQLAAHKQPAKRDNEPDAKRQAKRDSKPTERKRVKVAEARK